MFPGAAFHGKPPRVLNQSPPPRRNSTWKFVKGISLAGVSDQDVACPLWLWLRSLPISSRVPFLLQALLQFVSDGYAPGCADISGMVRG